MLFLSYIEWLSIVTELRECLIFNISDDIFHNFYEINKIVIFKSSPGGISWDRTGIMLCRPCHRPDPDKNHQHYRRKSVTNSANNDLLSGQGEDQARPVMTEMAWAPTLKPLFIPNVGQFDVYVSCRGHILYFSPRLQHICPRQVSLCKH